MNLARPSTVIALFVVLTLPLMPLQQLFIWFWPRMARTFPMYYHRVVCRILGVRVEVTGEIPQHGPLLLASNHVSWIDIVVLSSMAPVSFVAKSEVAGWPFFGHLARPQRTVFVERRAQRTAAHKDEMTERLNAGDSLVLFPEGTSSDGNHVLPFKSAFFALAETRVRDAALTVQPVSVAYTAIDGLPIGRDRRPELTWFGDLDLAPHLWGVLCLDRFTVTVQFHAPVTIESFSSRKELAAHCQAVVAGGLSDALSGRVQLPAPKRRRLARRVPQP